MVKSLKTCLRNQFYRLVVPSVARRLKSMTPPLREPEELVDFVAGFRHRGLSLAPSQVRTEIVQLLAILRQNPPATVLEIGTFRGGTFFLLGRVAREDALLLTMDLPEAQGGRAEGRDPLYQAFARSRQHVTMVRADSHTAEAVQRVRALIEGRPLDFLLIDGDHSYAGVKTDYELYSPLVRTGGLIAFHDIVPGPLEKVGGVPRFWEEIKRDRPVRELVADWHQGGFGIGLLTR